jgi:photosystem II stability/assembly factor-like uncharacterized protein
VKRLSVLMLASVLLCLWVAVAPALAAAPAPTDVTVAAQAAGAGPVTEASATAAAGGGGTWTIAVYENADNDLDYTWPRFTLPALKGIPTSPGVNVVAMVDRESKTGSFLYRIRGTRMTTVKHWAAERDFGKGATFEWFLREVHSRFPSDHLIVVGCDHGYGWRYFSHDYHADDAITMPELRAALAGAGVPVDILEFDACNMGDVEVAYDLASVDDPRAPGVPLVKYLVASVETVDPDGAPYSSMFAPLAADPGRSPLQVTDDMLRGWDLYYGSLRFFNWVSLSTVDMTAVRAAGRAMADLAGRLRAGLVASPHEYGEGIARAVRSSLAAWDSWQVDLGMLADRIADGHGFDSDPGVVAAAQAVRDAESKMVLGVTSGSYVRWFTGLTVWMGTGAEWKEYRDAYEEQSLFGAEPAAGGVGWYRLLKLYQASGRADPAMPLPDWPQPTYGLTDVYFSDAQHGWATGYDNVKSESVVLRTSDGGRLWRTARPSGGGAYSANSLASVPGGALWVAGSEGWDGALISRSADRGATWTIASVPTLEYLLGIQAPTKKVGYAAGTGGALVRTADGGRTWKSVATAPPGDLLGLRFTSATDGWALADDRVTVSGTVQRTTDGGATWTAQTTVLGTLLYAVDSVGQQVWVAGGDPAAGPILGGERVSGDGVLLHSPDGGVHWETQWGGAAADLRLNDVDMLNAQTGWAVGDATAAQHALVLHTTDGGATWTEQDPGVTFDLAAVHVLGAQTAWAVGDGEQILATTDGGATWTATRGDVVGPVTRVRSAAVTRGRRVVLHYTVADEVSTLANVTLRVTDGHGHALLSRSAGWVRTGSSAHVLVLRVLLPRGSYNVRALAMDRAGNAQSSAVAGKLRVREVAASD